MPADTRCPECGSVTVLRTAKKGRNAGRTFYVCIRYPECKGKVPIRKQINKLEWSDEKLKAHYEKETFDPNLIKDVYNVWDLHDKEINEVWHRTNPQQRSNLVMAFRKELESGWPTEFSEIQLKKVFHENRESLIKSIEMAYAAGIMLGKGWISMEHLSDFNLCLGDKLARDIRSILKRTKSRGIAFATAFTIVSVRGHLAASRIVH